jgi:hypothetical protein
MSRVGFEPTIPVLERAKTAHNLDRAATVIGLNIIHNPKIATHTFNQTVCTIRKQKCWQGELILLATIHINWQVGLYCLRTTCVAYINTQT